MQSDEKITSLGWATENDGALGGDDAIGNWDNHQWPVAGMDEGQDYVSDFTASG